MTTRVEIENPESAVWDVLVRTESLTVGVQRNDNRPVRPDAWKENPLLTIKPGNKVVLFIHSGMRITKVEERRHAPPKVEQEALEALLRQNRLVTINEEAHGFEAQKNGAK